MTETLSMERGRWSVVSVYAAAHFVVDFASAYLMFRSIVGMPDGYFYVLIYNFCAFAMQMPLGIIADWWNHNVLVAVFGCILVGFACMIRQIPIAAVIVVGTGNALFHLGAGIDVLNISTEKSRFLGLFVSPGAFGVYFGTVADKNAISYAIVQLALLTAVLCILLTYRLQGGSIPQNTAPSSVRQISPHVLIAVGCLFIVVCLRSYIGLSMSFQWTKTGDLAVMLLCAVVLGKAVGGFAADCFGVIRVSLFSLGAAGLLFLISQFPLPGIAAVLLFNMTMPITLWGMARIFPAAKGFAFGLLTFGLFMGFLPTFFGLRTASGTPWLFALLTAVSLALSWVGLRKGLP